MFPAHSLITWHLSQTADANTSNIRKHQCFVVSAGSSWRRGGGFENVSCWKLDSRIFTLMRRPPLDEVWLWKTSVENSSSAMWVFFLITHFFWILVNDMLPNLPKCRTHLLQVTFLYPSRPNHTILKGLNLTIPAKKLTCIMGPSGCGKSTVMSLLMRLYEPLTGSITLDGVDISRLDIVFLRSLIGLVQQEPVRPLVCCRP